MDFITDEDIRGVMSRGAFEAGLEYQMAGQVQNVRTAPNGLIEAWVKGSARAPYRQVISTLRRPDGKLAVSGSCSCPVRFNCKHVAAALFAIQEGAPQTPAAAAMPGGGAPLTPEIEAWLRDLVASREVETEDYPPTVRKRLIYQFCVPAQAGDLTLDLQAIEIKRDGRETANGSHYTAHQLLTTSQQPKFLRPSDRAIVRRLAGYGTRSEEFVDTLRNIIATGRGRWGAWDGPALREAAPVTGKLAWMMSNDGRQRARLELPGGLQALHLAAPWYVDPASGAMGPVETELPARTVRAMLASPWLSPDMAARVRDEIDRRLPEHRLPAPEPVAPPQLLRERLQPRLDLRARMAPERAEPSDHLPVARLSWRYGPVTLSAGPGHSIVMHGGRLLQVVRDARAEAAATQRLRGLGFARVSHLFSPAAAQHASEDLVLSDDDPAAWIEFMLDDLPSLLADGWLVDVADDFPVRLATPSGEVSIVVEERSGVDWFDVDLGVMVEGERVNLVPALLELLADPDVQFDLGDEAVDQAPLLLPLPDGRLLAVPLKQIKPILAPLLELFTLSATGPGAGLRLSRHDAGDLALLEAASAAAGIAWAGGEAICALGRQLREHGGIPSCPAPSRFAATLRAYQERGLAWLQFLRAAGLGGVLADDMGLGKTVQALAHLVVEQEAGRLDRPALVICPTSLVPNWRAEVTRFAPTLRTLVLHGPARRRRFADIDAHDLVVTTYPLLARDHVSLAEHAWHVVVLDEAQTIKNPLAATSKLARTLQARQRLCLSGTPIENHLGELWSLFDFLMPGFLGERQAFGRRFRAPIEKGGNVERQSLLARRVAPFLLRRTKGEVAADLPAKTEIAETVELNDGQRALYESIRLAMHARVRAAIAQRGLAGSGIVILDALLKLRQVCCDPRLLKLASAKAAKAGSAKLDRLMEMLPALLEDGRRVLLFSQFTSMLALIEAELDRMGQPYALLTGDTTDRATPIERFQRGGVPLFLISLKAGGVGLNLTAADTVIHYDPWWNPAVENQATDRAHRIGQDKPVFVHRLITAGTIEEKMQAMQQRKQAIAAGILGAGREIAPALTEADLEALFAPI